MFTDIKIFKPEYHPAVILCFFCNKFQGVCFKNCVACRILHRFFWKHKGPQGEQKYSEIFLEHFLIDCASSDATTLAFLVHKMGENNIVFGSDYCGGLGPLSNAFNAVSALANPDHFKSFTDKNSRRLLHI